MFSYRGSTPLKYHLCVQGHTQMPLRPWRIGKGLLNIDIAILLMHLGYIGYGILLWWCGRHRCLTPLEGSALSCSSVWLIFASSRSFGCFTPVCWITTPPETDQINNLLCRNERPNTRRARCRIRQSLHNEGMVCQSGCWATQALHVWDRRRSKQMGNWGCHFWETWSLEG